MSTTRESTITRAILAYLNDLPGCHAVKNAATVMGAATVDITGCSDGRMFQLEVKAPGGRATPRQTATLRQWARAGAITAVVTSVDEVRGLIELKPLIDWPRD